MKPIFLTLVILFSCIKQAGSNTLENPMDISTILYNLTPFQQHLDPMEKIAAKEYAQELTQELYQSYDFIEMRLYEAPDSGNSYQALYASCRFKIELHSIKLEEVYCENKKTQNDLEHYIKQHLQKLTWSYETPVVQNDMYYGAQLKALLTADQIAKEGYICDHSFRPGYYSEIYIKEHRIELYQVNRWNSRSLDHKDNYYMRDVKFTIPLSQTGLPEQLRYDYKIDNLYIEFRDSSSPQNKECGNRMLAKIEDLSKE